MTATEEVAAPDETPGVFAEPTKLVTDPHVVVLHGTGHPDAIGGVGITHGVPGGLLKNWLAAHPHLANVLRPMTPGQFKAHAAAPMQSGFEPGLKAAAEAKTADDPAHAHEALTPHAPPAEPHADDPEHPPTPPAPETV